MLKMMRKGTIENPLFFRIVMGVLAAVFALSMGWWGFDNNDENTVAWVNEDPIPLEEYRQVYQNTAALYRELLQGEYDDKALRKRVIEELVERRLWLKEAMEMELFVSDEELRSSVIRLPGFQKEGKFDPERYRRVLAFEKLTPTHFERQKRRELLIEKAKTLVKDAVALTPDEIEGAGKANSSDPAKAISELLLQKQRKSLHAYTLALKQKASITIKETLL